MSNSVVHSTKINNVKVKKVKFLVPDDTRPIKGADLFPKLCCNIFECAKQFSGKSTTTYNIIKKCVSKGTKVIVFCATLHNDDCWIAIQKYCEDKGIAFDGHTSIFDDDGDNLLEGLVTKLRDMKKMGDERMRDNEDEQIQDEPLQIWGQEEWKKQDEIKPKKKRKSKFQDLDYMIILDDISVELKNKWVTALTKIHRHFKAKVIISSQAVTDLAPGARNQMNYTLVYGGMPDDRLEKIRICSALQITLEQLQKMYEFATEKKYSFLYIDAYNNRYRRNFDTEISIPR
jgi:hypothetical protein